MSNPIANQLLIIKLTPKNLPSEYPLSSALTAKILYKNSQGVEGEVNATIDLINSQIIGEIPADKVTEGYFIYHGQLTYLVKILMLEAKRVNIVPKFFIV